jgi:hypothetical protein
MRYRSRPSAVTVQSCVRSIVVLTFVLASADCRRPPAREPALVPVVQQMGAWEGSGSQTLGLVSQSGKFRIRWQARPEPGHDAAAGTFKLTVHSGVSGRPLQEVVDLTGPGEGSYNFEDDPRPFNLMVDSQGLLWSISVDETVLVKPAADAVHR